MENVDSNSFAVDGFPAMTSAKLRPFSVSCTKFHPNRPRNVENKDINSFTLLRVSCALQTRVASWCEYPATLSIPPRRQQPKSGSVSPLKSPITFASCQVISSYVSLCHIMPVYFTSCHLYQLMSIDVSLSVCYFLSVCQFLLHSPFSPHPPPPTSTSTAALPPSLCLSQHTVHPVRPISNSRT